MTDRRTLAIFDFDKTLVAGDSFRLFGGICAKGPAERALLFGYAALAKLGVVSNTRYKEIVLKRVWHRLGTDERSMKLAQLHTTLRDWLVEAVAAAMQAHLARGDRVIVLSASPTFYLAPFLREISPDVEVHGSGVDESNGVRVTNLYGKAKAAIAGGLIADSQPDETHVYTDHRHDLALMKLADRTTLVGPNKATVAAVDDAGLTYEIWLP